MVVQCSAASPDVILWCTLCEESCVYSVVMLWVSYLFRMYVIVQSVCNYLGYNYSPFAWTEEHCEDITEDYDAGVLRILDKFNRDSETAIPEEFCELLKC